MNKAMNKQMNDEILSIISKSDDENYTADWNAWFQGYEEQHTKFRGTSKKDAFDSTVDGSWLDRWDT